MSGSDILPTGQPVISNGHLCPDTVCLATRQQQQDQVSYQSKTHRTILAAPHIWRVRANDVIRALDSGMPAGS